MSDESHSICERCWVEANSDRWPIRARCADDHAHQCCFCGNMTWAGIYVLGGDPSHCDHNAYFAPDHDSLRNLNETLKKAQWN